jgi:hypothetical protein
VDRRRGAAYAASMPDENCPKCHASIGAPGAFHGQPTRAWHTHLDCDGCGTPLIWFKDSAIPEGWQVDEDEIRRRRLEAEDS